MNIIYISIRGLLIDSIYESIYKNVKLLILTYKHFQGLPQILHMSPRISGDADHARSFDKTLQLIIHNSLLLDFCFYCSIFLRKQK